MTNLGKTDFASCVFQQLVNIPEFADMILKYPVAFQKPKKYDFADDLLC